MFRDLRFSSALVTAAVLTGCGAATVGPPSATLAAPSVAVHPQRAQSWMSPAAAGAGALLYISDEGTLDVDVYSYPADKLVGTLTGFKLPNGLCSDAQGNVYVADFGAQRTLEYAHGGTKPIATIVDPGYSPESCAFDPRSGNLAIINEFGPDIPSIGSPGDIDIYEHEKGKPKQYRYYDKVFYPIFSGYDDKSNLFVDGFASQVPSYQQVVLAELPKGGKQPVVISLPKSIYSPGGVQWHGKYLEVGDQKYQNTNRSAVNSVVIAGTAGTIVKTWSPYGAVTIPQFTIRGTHFIGPDSNAARVGIWTYGSSAFANELITGLEIPFGSAISEGKK